MRHYSIKEKKYVKSEIKMLLDEKVTSEFQNKMASDTMGANLTTVKKSWENRFDQVLCLLVFGYFAVDRLLNTKIQNYYSIHQRMLYFANTGTS